MPEGRVDKRMRNSAMRYNRQYGVQFAPDTPLPIRYSTAYIAVATRAWEERLRSLTLRIFTEATDRIQLEAMETGAATPDAAWRNVVLDFARARLREAARDVLVQAVEYSQMAYQFGWYAGLWQLQVSGMPDVRIKQPPAIRTNITAPTEQRTLQLKLQVARIAQLSGRLDADEFLTLYLGDEFREFFDTEFEDMLLRIRKGMNAGFAAGDDIPAMTTRLKNGVGLGYRSGIKGPMHRIDVLARTAVLMTRKAGVAEVLRENAPKLGRVQYLTAMDEKVCPICRPLHGRVWPVGSPEVRQPPLHPNCRCDLVPVMDQEDVFGAEEDMLLGRSENFPTFTRRIGVYELVQDLIANGPPFVQN